MVSLSTVYGISAALGTVTAFLAAYTGHTIYPIQTGGSIASAIENVTEQVKRAAEDFMKPAPEQPLNTEVTPLEPPVEEQHLPQVELPTPSEQQPATE